MPGDCASSEIPILRYASLDSTQLEARRLLERSPPSAATAPPVPFAVVAREQTDGRGRDGRVWVSPRGGLWVTAAWPLPARLEPLLGLRIGLAVRDAIVALVPHIAGRLRLKWPNDLMLDDGKVAGMLTETLHGPGSQRIALVGVGVNADIRRDQLPEPLRWRAAALSDVAGAGVDLDQLLDGLLTRQRWLITRPELAGAVIRRVNDDLHGRGETVTLMRADGSKASGVLTHLDSRGQPCLRDDRGSIEGPFTGFAPAPPSSQSRSS